MLSKNEGVLDFVYTKFVMADKHALLKHEAKQIENPFPVSLLTNYLTAAFLPGAAGGI